MNILEFAIYVVENVVRVDHSGIGKLHMAQFHFPENETFLWSNIFFNDTLSLRFFTQYYVLPWKFLRILLPIWKCCHPSYSDNIHKRVALQTFQLQFPVCSQNKHPQACVVYLTWLKAQCDKFARCDKGFSDKAMNSKFIERTHDEH